MALSESAADGALRVDEPPGLVAAEACAHRVREQQVVVLRQEPHRRRGLGGRPGCVGKVEQLHPGRAVERPQAPAVALDDLAQARQARERGDVGHRRRAEDSEVAHQQVVDPARGVELEAGPRLERRRGDLHRRAPHAAGRDLHQRQVAPTGVGECGGVEIGELGGEHAAQRPGRHRGLGEHVAACSGIPFAEYLAEGVLGPLGMTSSVLDGGAGQGLRSNVTDLLRLAAELRSPTLVHDSTLALMTTVQFPELIGVVPGWGQHSPCPWGLGPEIRGDKAPHWTGSRCSPATFGHFGGGGSLLWIDPVAQLTCIAVTDRPFDAWAVVAWPPFSDAVQTYFSASAS